MGNTDSTPKKSWIDGLKAEFKKIIWPTQQDLVKQTTAVVAVSIVLGIIIALLDFIIQYGVDFLVNLSFQLIKDKGDCMAEANWYVVHTYSGYENKVKANIEKTI